MYQPSSPARAESATLTLLGDAGPLTVALSGTGLAAAASASPASLTFAAQPKGQSSQPLSFAIDNPGTDALTISAYGLSGANVGDFAISSSPTAQVAPVSTSVAAGGSQRYYVVFTPSTLAGEAASLTFQTSAGPVSIALLGASIGAALAFDSSGEEFGSVRVDSAAAAITATVTNATAVPVTLDSFLLAGANARRLLGGAHRGRIVPAHAPGRRRGELHAGLHAEGRRRTLGDALARGQRAGQRRGHRGRDAESRWHRHLADPRGRAPGARFRQRPRRQHFWVQAVTIANHGTADLSITQLTISGPGAAAFSLVAPAPTVPQTLSVGASLTVMLEFAPGAVGSDQADLVVTTDDPLGATAQVALSGEGVSPEVAVSPTALAFGAVHVGSASSPMSLVLTNRGGASANLSSAAISGTNASDFSLPGLPSLPSALTSGSSLPLLVVFTPAAHGDRSATLTLVTELGEISIALSGSGLASGIGVMPGSLDFGSVALGNDPTLLQVAIQNLGDAPLDLSLLAIDGPGADSFRTTAVPDAGPLAPQATATFSVEYAPSMAETDTATLHVTSPDPLTAGVDVALAGIAVTPQLSLSSSLTFSSQGVGATSPPQQVTITNTSAATIVIDSVLASPSAFSAQLAGAPATVAPGATATAAVSFSPTMSGPIGGKMVVFVKGQATAVASVAMQGTGTTPASGCGTSGGGSTSQLAILAALALWMRRRSQRVGQLPQEQRRPAR